MIDNIDHNLGRLFATLREQQVYENTLVIFFSDNGANGATMAQYPGTDAAWVEQNSDNRFENLGRRGSRIAVGPGWALASMAPFRLFKAFISEGGIRSPLIVAGPGVKRIGQISHPVASVSDIMPTVLEMAGVAHPNTHEGRDVLPMQGQSMTDFLNGEKESVHGPDDVFGFELFGWRGIRQGDWKATWISRPFATSEWQLFNISNDPSETRDLALDQPERLIKLRQLWHKYADEVGVILPEQSLFNAP
jgi:arylsulfatase